MTDFDLAREFEPGRDYQRLIELPAGIVSLDGVTNVTLDFDTSEMTSTKLNVSNIRAINVPSNYELQILSSIVSGVTLYGPADEIEKLSADSIVAQIDCQSLNLTVGQQTIRRQHPDPVVQPYFCHRQLYSPVRGHVEVTRRSRGRAYPARGLAFAARLPYSAGPGMPGPYAVVVISQTA